MKRGTTSGARRIYEFGPFRLDASRHRLLHNGEVVALSRKSIETLIVLVQNPGKLLQREDLMEALWPDTVVEDANLTVAISQLRKALNQNCDTGEFIQTIPRAGYRFVAEVNKQAGGDLLPVPEAFEAVRSVPEIPNQRQSDAGAATKSGEVLELPATTGWLLAAGVLAIAVICFAALFFIRYGTRNSASSISTVLSGSARISEKSIAVLPFENLSDDKQNAYFAAGIQDETISDLATIAELKVISRTSANHYKSETARNSQQIGQQLGVAYLLEGSVQRIGNRLRVNAQLIDARTDLHIWAQTYDREVADLFAIQSEIAQAIAEQLHVKISPTAKAAIEQPPTINLSAFELYTRAKNLFLSASGSNRGKEDLLVAADLLNQAVARDPAFLQAYCQLAWTHDLLYILGDDHTPARLAVAAAAVEAALRLRPDAGEAHLARAENLYRGYLDYADALAELDVARQSLPNDSRIFELKAAIERRQGKLEEALRSFERAVDLDPRNISTLGQIALTYGYLRRYAEAKSASERAFAIEPGDIENKAGGATIAWNWKADTRPLHQVIDSIRATNPAAIRDIADNWLGCALAERDPAAAKKALVAAGQNSPLNDEAVHFNHAFAEGVIARMTNDEVRARLAFVAARAEQAKIVQAQPNYGPPLCVLGLIDAALGRKEEALREGRRAIELLPVEKDAINGPLMIEYFAMIAAWLGDKDLACEQLASAIRYPSSLGYGQLKLLPFWDPLRGDPCFEKIVSSLAPKS